MKLEIRSAVIAPDKETFNLFPNPNLGWSKRMEQLVGQKGTIKEIDLKDGSARVQFSNSLHWYPIPSLTDDIGEYYFISILNHPFYVSVKNLKSALDELGIPYSILD